MQSALLFRFIGVCGWLGLIAFPANMFAAPAGFKFVYTGEGTQVVAHPAASGKNALAVDVSPKTGQQQLGIKAPAQASALLPAGLYRVTVHARLHHRDSDDLSRLVIGLRSGSGKEFVWTQFDSNPQRFTPLSWEVSFAAPFEPSLAVSWRQVVFSTTERSRPIRPLETPDAPALKTASKLTSKQSAEVDDLLGELENTDKVAPLEEVDYPALLIDQLTLEPLSVSQYVALVRPRFIHVYPGQENPVSATLVNLEKRPVQAVAELTVVAGLDETIARVEQSVELPAGEQVSIEFPWTSGEREFGYEARVRLLVEGREVHAAWDYFSVSLPIWKTALQASGFLTWHGREEEFPEHVARTSQLFKRRGSL